MIELGAIFVLKELELELEKKLCQEFESSSMYCWLIGNRIGINSKFYLVGRKYNCNP